VGLGQRSRGCVGTGTGRGAAARDSINHKLEGERAQRGVGLTHEAIRMRQKLGEKSGW